MKHQWVLFCLHIAFVVLIAFLAAVMAGKTKAADVLDQVNDQRMRMGLDPLIPDAGLQAAAEAGSQAQARRGSMGHQGTMPSGSAEGVGHGRIGPPFRFKTCYHRPGDYTNYRYGGAAIVGGYATLSIDRDRNHGAIGSARSRGRNSGNNRRGFFGRRRH